MARLVVYFDRNKVGHYDFDEGQVRVGRHPDSDIFLPHQAVSRLQITLVKQGASWSVENAGGRNAVFVNGSVMKAPTPLGEDDRIEFGRYIIRFLLNPGDDIGSDVLETKTGIRVLDEIGVTASAAAPKPTGLEDGEGTTVYTLGKLRALRSRADKLNRPHLTWREQGKERLLNLSDEPVLIGSDEDMDICVPGGLLVAAEHAEVIQLDDESYEVAPCSWFGKLKVNDEAVKRSHILADGDRIQIGTTVVVFRTSMFEGN